MGRSTTLVRSGIPVLRGFTRLVSLATVLILLALLLDDLNPGKIESGEWVGLVFFPVGLMLGLIIGWFREGLGSAIALASIVGFCLVGLLFWGQLVGAVFAFSPAGLLFLLCWLLQRGHVRSSGR